MKKLLLVAALLIGAGSGDVFAACNPFTANTILTAAALNSAIADPCITAGTIQGASINSTSIGLTSPSIGSFTEYRLNGKKVSSSTAPTISSGFGTGAIVQNANGTDAFQVDIGTGGTAVSGVLAVPAANTGYNCHVDYNGPSVDMNTYTVASSSSVIAVSNQTSSTGANVAWPASTVLNFTCRGR